MTVPAFIQELWNHCRILRADVLSCGDQIEQTQIVAEVEQCLSVVDELVTVVNANLQRATRLRQSVLQQAFVGNLK